MLALFKMVELKESPRVKCIDLPSLLLGQFLKDIVEKVSTLH